MVGVLVVVHSLWTCDNLCIYELLMRKSCGIGGIARVNEHDQVDWMGLG